jgi:hypothetical protein
MPIIIQGVGMNPTIDFASIAKSIHGSLNLGRPKKTRGTSPSKKNKGQLKKSNKTKKFIEKAEEDVKPKTNGKKARRLKSSEKKSTRKIKRKTPKEQENQNIPTNTIDSSDEVLDTTIGDVQNVKYTQSEGHTVGIYSSVLSDLKDVPDGEEKYIWCKKAGYRIYINSCSYRVTPACKKKKCEFYKYGSKIKKDYNLTKIKSNGGEKNGKMEESED